MGKYYFAIVFVIMAALFLGCVSESEKGVVNTATPTTPKEAHTSDYWSELKKRILDREERLVHIYRIKQIDSTLAFEYGMDVATDSSVYGQMLNFMDEVYKYVEENNIDIKSVRFVAIFEYGRDEDTVYDLTVDLSEIQEYLEGKKGYDDWMGKVAKYKVKKPQKTEKQLDTPRISEPENLEDLKSEILENTKEFGLVHVYRTGYGDGVLLIEIGTDEATDAGNYGLMTNVMETVETYAKENGLTIDRLIIRTIFEYGREHDTLYQLNIPYADAEKFLSFNWGYKEWSEIVRVAIVTKS